MITEAIDGRYHHVKIKSISKTNGQVNIKFILVKPYNEGGQNREIKQLLASLEK